MYTKKKKNFLPENKMNNDFSQQIKIYDEVYLDEEKNDFEMPVFKGDTYYKDVATYPYFRALTTLRHFIKKSCDNYWGDIQNALNVDLFMLTQSVSSPMGPGSDSEAISIKFGGNNAYLVDSSQFGFEPLLLNGIKKVYCYLPSMRGENPNKRHLNQFYHCEAEISGSLDELKPQIEGFVKYLAQTLTLMPNLLNLLSNNYKMSVEKLSLILNKDKFDEMEFDEAVQKLKDSGFENLVNKTQFGNDITCEGETKLMELLNTKSPIWINHFDRDRVAFYQKPCKENKVINADLLFPPIVENSFGGEVVGAGQRQDCVEEIYESLKRQGLDSKPYEWYIDLRRQKNYKPTSGFGMGVERFIAWVLNRYSIQDVILYPRLKNIVSYP